MIDITIGSIEEKIIKLLQRTYPITVLEIAQKLRVSRREIEWILQKFHIKGIVRLEPLPDKTYVRLVRNDFRFTGSKQQRKTVKHTNLMKTRQDVEDNEMMYT